jgi:hypothetical protein
MTDREQDIPRRIRQDLFSPAERAIWDAAQVVEEMAPSVHLTDAVIFLAKARAKVADFVDGVPTEAHDWNRLVWLLGDVAERLPFTDVGRERYGELLGWKAVVEALGDHPHRLQPPAAGAGEGTEDVLAGHGCGDGYCDITGPATGMHTNGGCKCLAPLPMSRRTHVRVALQRYREALRAALAVPREQEPASEARRQCDTIMAEMSLSACIHGVPHVRAEACPDCAASTESEPAYVLEFCKSVIQDAIGLDDGLDGEAGTAVLAMIRNALARGAVPRGEGERVAWAVVQNGVVVLPCLSEEDATRKASLLPDTSVVGLGILR